jgi:hypothetical protein
MQAIQESRDEKKVKRKAEEDSAMEETKTSCSVMWCQHCSQPFQRRFAWAAHEAECESLSEIKANDSKFAKMPAVSTLENNRVRSSQTISIQDNKGGAHCPIHTSTHTHTKSITHTHTVHCSGVMHHYVTFHLHCRNSPSRASEHCVVTADAAWARYRRGMGV